MIHILIDNSIKEDSKNKINQVIEKFGNKFIDYKYYNLEGHFKGASIEHFPYSSYYRISLPSILPDLDKVIYTDIDVINLKDLSEMYSIEFKDKMYFCGTLENIHLLDELKNLGIEANKYFSAGIMLINLKAIRNDGIEKKIRDFIPNHILPTADQTAINAVCNNNIQILPYKYAIFAKDSFEKLVKLNEEQEIMYRFNKSELIQAFNEPTFFHYYDGHKPWKKNYLQFNRVYWWFYAKMSGFYLEILHHYKFKTNEIENLIKQIPENGGLLKRNYKKFT